MSERQYAAHERRTQIVELASGAEERTASWANSRRRPASSPLRDPVSARPIYDQASLRGVGYDCLGLARGIWREAVGPEPFPIPPYSRDWGETGLSEVLAEGARRMMPELAASEAKPGALMMPPRHRQACRYPHRP